MKTAPSLIVAALLTVPGVLVVPAFAGAQSAPDMGAARPPPAEAGPYAGAGSPHRFYDLGDRIDHLQARIGEAGLPRRQSARATRQLAAIRAELKYRVARKNGQLLDWDRELITHKLDVFVQQFPMLASAPS